MGCQKQLEQKYKDLHTTQQLKIKPRFQELEILCQKLEKDFNCLTEEQIQIQSLHGSLEALHEQLRHRQRMLEKNEHRLLLREAELRETSLEDNLFLSETLQMLERKVKNQDLMIEDLQARKDNSIKDLEKQLKNLTNENYNLKKIANEKDTKIQILEDAIKKNKSTLRSCQSKLWELEAKLVKEESKKFTVETQTNHEISQKLENFKKEKDNFERYIYQQKQRVNTRIDELKLKEEELK